MSLRHKLLWILLLTALAGAVAVAGGAVWVVRNAVRDNYLERIRAETATLADWVRRLPPAEAQRFAVDVAARLGVRVTLIDANGVVLGDSAKDVPGVAAMENHGDRPEIVAAGLRGTGESMRLSDTTNVRYFYSASIVEGDGPVKYARVALPASRVERVQQRHQWLLSGVVLGAMLLLAAVSYGAVRRLSKPIERMAEVAERIAGGEFDLELRGGGRYEVGRLAAAVTRMKRSLLRAVREQRDDHALLLSVLSDMKEGLLVVDPERRVRLANRAIREELDLTFDPTGRMLAEVVRYPTVIDVAEQALDRQVETREPVFELPGSGRSFEISATPLAGGAGAIVLLFDITRIQALEGVRRQFVANVSHELRTPLTSIKAFVETLIAGDLDDPRDGRKFLDIIKKHADRMEVLIEDLTDLSRIETGSVELALESLDAARVAGEVVENLRPRIEEYDVDVRVDLPQPFRVRADRHRLEQILTNLLDNAVKFNRPGGTVRVHGSVRHGRPTLVVEDTGIGIPADRLDQVFNRFFRVDVARSREAGGTGLGLAIVKHLMRLHGGQVRVESELGEGSRFILEFARDASLRSSA